MKRTSIFRFFDGMRFGWRKVRRVGFTLVELLVAMAVFSMIVLLLFQTMSSSASIWSGTAGKVQVFQASRAAFETLTRNLGQATLQTYYGYTTSNGIPVPLLNPSFSPVGVTLDRTQVPARYDRMSELHFICADTASLLSDAGVTNISAAGNGIFFEAPLGHVNNDTNYDFNREILNACGYFVQFCDNSPVQPAFVTNLAIVPKLTYRYRLIEVLQSGQNMAVYNSTAAINTNTTLPVYQYDLNWFSRLFPSNSASQFTHVLADNVLFILFLPKLSPEDESRERAANSLSTNSDGSFLSPTYTYDSRAWEVPLSTSPSLSYSAIDYLYYFSTISYSTNLVALTKNQMPPIIEVIMVAIDERSAQRLSIKYGMANGDSPPLDHATLRTKLGLDNGFQDAALLENDLTLLEQGLIDEQLNYRIFRTDVRVQGAKWSPN